MSADRILLTGATGFIGRILAGELQRSGFTARCAVRDLSVATGLCPELVEVGEVGGATDWGCAVEGIDVVIHLVARAHILKEMSTDPVEAFNAVNLEGTRRLAETAAAKGVKRLVYVSSIGVNGDHTLSRETFSEESPAMPYNAYAASKYAAEKALNDIAARTGLEVVILRPPLVYGPGNPGNFMRLLKLVGRGIPLPMASVRNQRSMIYVANLVDALIAAAIAPEAAGHVYLVSDTETISTPGLIVALGALMGKPVRLWPFPVTGLRFAAKLLGRSSEIERLTGSLVINSSKIRQQMGWSAPFTLQQGLEQTVRWYRGDNCAR